MLLSAAILLQQRESCTLIQTGYGGKYQIYSGDLSVVYSTLTTKTFLKATLGGYSTGTVDVPKIISDNQKWSDGARFIFGAEFSSGLIKNLFEYFDQFNNRFHDSKNTDNYSQVAIKAKRLSDLGPETLPNYHALENYANKAQQASRDLDSQEDDARNLRAQLQYMKGQLEEYNLPEALRQADEMLQQVGDGRNGVLSLIAARRDALRDKFDITSKWNFSKQLPALPAYFCTADPDVKTATFAVPESLTIFPFSINSADWDRRTCRVMADLYIYQWGNSTVTGRGYLRLLKKKDGQTSGRDIKDQWDAVEEKTEVIGQGGVVDLIVGPAVFVPSQEVMYAVDSYVSSLPGRNLTLTTWVSRQYDPHQIDLTSTLAKELKKKN